jgi:hypothetical protein
MSGYFKLADIYPQSYRKRSFEFNGMGISMSSNDPAALSYVEDLVRDCVPKKIHLNLFIHKTKAKSDIFRIYWRKGYTLSRASQLKFLASGIAYRRRLSVFDIFVSDERLSPEMFKATITRIINQRYKRYIEDPLFQRYFALHASSVCYEGKGAMFIGPRGYGKSTICLHLVKRGFGFISDNISFIKDNDGLIKVLNVDNTISIRNLGCDLDINRLAPECIVKRGAQVRLLFFLSKIRDRLKIQRIPPHQAMISLLGRALFSSPYQGNKKTFAFLSLLLSKTRQYRLSLTMGDLDQLPDIIRYLCKNGAKDTIP